MSSLLLEDSPAKMIICPDCSYQNLADARQCAVCDLVLPSMQSCPNCGASIQSGAQFCGQCGHSLAQHSPLATDKLETAIQRPPQPSPKRTSHQMPAHGADFIAEEAEPLPPIAPPIAPLAPARPALTSDLSVRLVHLQTNAFIELPQENGTIHMGKPNGQVLPDIDITDLPHAEVVSRSHADIRIESGAFFIEDRGSSNGTYINNVPLLPAHPHRLKSGDHISLGKGDLVTFLFQMD
ncbi:MAG: FHA domain-containing protein [Thermosynechococcaceae cyanobacterium]